jgi:hypothetical protein
MFARLSQPINPSDDGVLGGFRIPQAHLLRRSKQPPSPNSGVPKAESVQFWRVLLGLAANPVKIITRQSAEWRPLVQSELFCSDFAWKKAKPICS